MSNVLIISADCHAGDLPATYKEYMPSKFHVLDISNLLSKAILNIHHEESVSSLFI